MLGLQPGKFVRVFTRMMEIGRGENETYCLGMLRDVCEFYTVIETDSLTRLLKLNIFCSLLWHFLSSLKDIHYTGWDLLVYKLKIGREFNTEL